MFRFVRAMRWLVVALIVGGVAHAEQPVLRVGVTSEPYEEIFEVAKQVAEREYGLDIQIVAFNDYIQPDAALAASDLGANSYQYRPVGVGR